MLEAIRDILAWVFRPVFERHRGNLRLVAGCLLLSSLIWFFNSLNKKIEANVSIPLKINYNDRLFIPLSTLPQKVEVTISGSGWHLLRLSLFNKPSKIHVWIKHPSLYTKLDTLVVRHYLDVHLEGVSVDKMYMDSTYLPFDHITHKLIHLAVNEYSISLADGVIRDSTIAIQPESIIVSGPATVVNELMDTLEVSIPFKKLDKNFDESIRLTYFLHDPKLSCSHETVRVKFKVRKKPIAHG